jgi:phospholipase/lecithinase/hemolysin
MKTTRYVLCALLIAFLLSGSAYAASISRIVVLGDSLSDNGNLYHLIGYPPSPYWFGRFSNGPVAVEYLAEKLGVTLNDFAVGGATTGVGNVADGGTVDIFGALGLPGITTVLQGALLAGSIPIDPDALYIVWGGPNDFWAVDSQETAQTAIAKAVTNLLDIVGTLQLHGAQHILVANMPDLGKTPFFLGQGSQTSYFFTQLSSAFNQTLKAKLPQGVHYFDGSSLLSNMIAHPDHYGFTNVTDELILSPGADPSKYLFWDDVHPTTVGHSLMGNALYESVAPTVIIGECNSGVPNPLFSTGLTVSDLIAQAAFSAKNHGQFVSAVSSITNELKKSGVISGSQKGAIQGCAAQATIP